MKSLICFFYLTCLSSQLLIAQSLFPDIKHPVIVIAHRGYHINVPENTLASFGAAIDCHADFVEMDLRTTKDGRMILMHDATVNRTTNGKGQVKDFTYEELRRMRISPASSSDTNHYSVPLFTEALQLCKNRIHIYLDFKDANVAEAYQFIKAAGMEKQVVVYLNKEEQYSAWKAAAPAMPLMASIPDEIKTEAALTKFLDTQSIQITDSAAPEIWPFLRKKNIAIWLDVQSSDEGPAKWKAALQNGAQGLQTDHPQQLISFLK